MRNIPNREILSIPQCECCGALTPNRVCNACIAQQAGQTVRGGQGRDSGDVMGTYAILVGILVIGVVGGFVGGVLVLMMGGK